MADQQFCLRWNNHQSTLISVFDSLQERGCMVDCTLAAEGRSLKAHKVVLSACSPYLEELLSQHYDKHPILLLKDVKFEELKAMMDYMYRGEVNVAQDKLGTFLRAAESLQIKGLSDSGGSEPPDSGGGGSSVSSGTKRTNKGIAVAANRASAGTSVEPRRPPPQPLEVQLDTSSRDGSISPNLRKRRRRRGSLSTDDVDVNDTAGNAPESHAPPPAAAPATAPSAPNTEMLPTVPSSDATDATLGLLSSLMESSHETDGQQDATETPAVPPPPRENVIKEKQEPTSEILIEPKTEYLDDEDDQDLMEDSEMDSSMFRPGPSHGRHGSGYQMQVGDQSDEVFMAAQDAVGVNRDAQDS